MCGIAGLIYPSSKPSPTFQDGRCLPQSDGKACDPTMESMVATMHHRGPDGHGFWSTSAGDCQVHLGHARLAILDLSDAAQQPMIDPASGCVLVYNGELYNFRELRDELVRDGYSQFDSSGDTQVLLRAYVRWGPSFLHKLRGMFAFAIYDPRIHKLLLARDQLGIKPLYLVDGKGFFAFASEVRALLKVPGMQRSLDPQGLKSFLAYGSVQDPYTLVSGVRSIPAGHSLTLDFSKGRLAVGESESFHDFSEISPILTGMPEREIVRRVREALTDSVRSHLASDVPLGVFLSGGMDSSALVALMSEMASTQVHTLNVAFEEAAFDESEIARKIARRFGTKHTEIRLTAEAFLKDIPSWLKSFDQPSYDGANVWIVSKACKEAGLTVALSGLGSDELFGGYPTFRRTVAASRLFRGIGFLPRYIRNALATAIGFAGDHSISSEKIAEWISGNGSRLTTYLNLRRVFMPGLCQELLIPSAAVAGGRLALSREVLDKLMILSQNSDPYTAVSLLEMKTYMLNTLLRDSDQMSMAHSLEIRVPFVDVKLAELILQLPKDRGFSVNGNKPLLQAALHDRLGPTWGKGPKKTFTLPFDLWLKGALKSEVEQRLTTLSNPPFQRDAVLTLWRNFLKGTNKVNSSQIIMLFALSYWIDEYQIGR
jgi:asparagine synthase (glutamine-hydrolysing)